MALVEKIKIQAQVIDVVNSTFHGHYQLAGLSDAAIDAWASRIDGGNTIPQVAELLRNIGTCIGSLSEKYGVLPFRKENNSERLDELCERLFHLVACSSITVDLPNSGPRTKS